MTAADLLDALSTPLTVETYRPQAGDVLLVTLPTHTSPSDADLIHTELHERLGPLGVTVLIKTEDIGMQVVRPETEGAGPGGTPTT